MQIRDLLLLILKLYGISILLFDVLPMLITNMGILPNAFQMGQADMILYGVGIIMFPLIVALILIFAGTWLINILQLEAGFQSEEVLLNNTSHQQIAQLAIIFLGGYLIIDNATSTIAHIVENFKISLYPFETNTYHNFWKSGLSVFIGALLIANREALAKWLMPKTEE